MIGIIFIGAPCSGKSMIAKELCKELEIPYISSGDIARMMANNNDDIAKKLNKGEMAPEVIMRGEIAKAILRADKIDKGAVILDGFPRFQEQYEWLVSSFVNMKFICVFVDAFTTTLFNRNMSRGRDDDNMESFMKRMRYYVGNTLPILLQMDVVHRVYNDGIHDDIEDIAHMLSSKIRRDMDAFNSKT